MSEATRRRILVFQHMALEGPGLFAALMAERGLGWDSVHLYRGDAIPELAAYDMLLVMGGAQDVWEEDEHPWLAAEKAAIRKWVKELDRPYLGICLGHQLLANALGGQVGPAPALQMGFHDVSLTEAGLTAPPFAGLPQTSRWMQWHAAEVKIPPAEAHVLAASPACAVEAIQVGRHAYGLQFHAEASRETLATWSTLPGYDSSVRRAFGPDGHDRLHAAVEAELPAINRNAAQLFGGLIEQFTAAAAA